MYNSLGYSPVENCLENGSNSLSETLLPENSRHPRSATSLLKETITIGGLEEFQNYSFSVAIATSVGFNPLELNGEGCNLTDPASE